MPSYEQVKYALKHSKEFRKLIPDIATFRAAMVHSDLRIKLFDHLLKHPKSLHKLLTGYLDFKELFQIDREFLQASKLHTLTYQGLFFNKLIEDPDLLNRVIKDDIHLQNLAYLIKISPINEKRKIIIRVQLIEKLMSIENKFLDLYHPGDATSRNCSSRSIAHDRHDWPPEFITLLTKLEVEQLFPIIFAEFRVNNFSNHDNFMYTLEDMRLRWKTFNKFAYEFCVTELQAILKLSTMTDPHNRFCLVSYLECCENSRPKDVKSLLDPVLKYKLKIDPGFELYPPSVFEAFLASQQEKGLLEPIPTGVINTTSTSCETSMKALDSPSTVNFSKP